VLFTLAFFECVFSPLCGSFAAHAKGIHTQLKKLQKCFFFIIIMQMTKKMHALQIEIFLIFLQTCVRAKENVFKKMLVWTALYSSCFSSIFEEEFTITSVASSTSFASFFSDWETLGWDTEATIGPADSLANNLKLSNLHYTLKKKTLILSFDQLAKKNLKWNNKFKIKFYKFHFSLYSITYLRSNNSI